MNQNVNTHDSQRVRTLAPLRDFLRTESAGAVLLAGGALLAPEAFDRPELATDRRRQVSTATVNTPPMGWLATFGT